MTLCANRICTIDNCSKNNGTPPCHALHLHIPADALVLNNLFNTPLNFREKSWSQSSLACFCMQRNGSY